MTIITKRVKFFFKKKVTNTRRESEEKGNHETNTRPTGFPQYHAPPSFQKIGFPSGAISSFFLRFFFNYGKIDVYTHRFFPFHSFLFGSPLLLLFFRTTLRSARIHTQKKTCTTAQ
ncbi:hypothetical protein, unlikely [Trypanosoma brucei gambiense DAL972]|uniref:Uncharacterized protein n=1 Tax=Trypanosoma brucei gambiense (strain MHOM/CI/86/DAL972) TaxID=679716 RepID=D0AAQ0_TRYB9|nr:hypothetical protein, unlikely [Trypanosoma brucei gambiense DAL972]CBH18751.1 hypothetical protein, unlikely [Trypanosoma brucei gambiense DAL972]|eukprot:XP_011781015.1 hypothetical protein, unlikely [Trypanosoma brucei gambiense DAL972]